MLSWNMLTWVRYRKATYTLQPQGRSRPESFHCQTRLLYHIESESTFPRAPRTPLFTSFKALPPFRPFVPVRVRRPPRRG